MRMRRRRRRHRRRSRLIGGVDPTGRAAAGGGGGGGGALRPAAAAGPGGSIRGAESSEELEASLPPSRRHAQVHYNLLQSQIGVRLLLRTRSEFRHTALKKALAEAVVMRCLSSSGRALKIRDNSSWQGSVL